MMAVMEWYTSQVVCLNYEYTGISSTIYHLRYHTAIPILCAKQGKQQKECTNSMLKNCMLNIKPTLDDHLNI